jgi:hypothetical protein
MHSILSTILICHMLKQWQESLVRGGGDVKHTFIQQLRNEKGLICMLTCSWVHGPMIAGQPMLSFCHGWSDTFVYLQTTKAAKLWTHWSQPFCRGPQGETLGVLDTSFCNSSERTQQQMLNLSPMVCSSYQKGSGHSFVLHPSKYMSLSLPHNFIRSQYSSFQTLCSHSTFWDSDGIKATPPPV